MADPSIDEVVEQYDAKFCARAITVKERKAVSEALAFVGERRDHLGHPAGCYVEPKSNKRVPRLVITGHDASGVKEREFAPLVISLARLLLARPMDDAAIDHFARHWLFTARNLASELDAPPAWKIDDTVADDLTKMLIQVTDALDAGDNADARDGLAAIRRLVDRRRKSRFAGGRSSLTKALVTDAALAARLPESGLSLRAAAAFIHGAAELAGHGVSLESLYVYARER